MFVWCFLSCFAPDDPCTEMCAAAASLYGGCLTSWGAGWEAAGYADDSDFIDACGTWAGEERQLEAAAGQDGATDLACQTRAKVFASDTATCDDFTEIDWSTPPWEGG